MQIIVVTLVGMTLCGVNAWVVFVISEQYNIKLAEQVNWIVGAVLAMLYVTLNIGLLIPGVYHKKRELDKWRSKSESTAVHRKTCQITPIQNKDNAQGILEYHLDLTLT